MYITSKLLEQIVAHAQEEPTVEVCGLIAVRPAAHDGEPAEALSVHRATNIHHSALKFEIASQEQFELYKRIDAEDCEIGGLYHSHVRSRPYPSQTDINFAAAMGKIEWIIVGLAVGQEPEVRSYLIEDGDVQEVALQVR
jgi:[CysO sulfur-carrier protein]-S-L-cysteine hydrolase